MPHSIKTGLSDSLRKLTSVSALDSADAPRHRWYFVKEAFSPDLAKCAIQETISSPSGLVFDPFAGGGTVPLAAKQGGHNATALEVNPFLAFVGNTKLIQVLPRTLEKHALVVREGAKIGETSSLDGFSTFGPKGATEKWLFNSGVLCAFEGGFTAAMNTPRPTQQLLRLALIGAAMDVCNAVKDGKCLRYRSGWAERRYGSADFLEAFDYRIGQMTEDLEADPLPDRTGRIVACGDARRKIRQPSPPPLFDLCVTSPPYLNSFDYTDVYRPELFLGRFMDSMKRLRQLRFRTLRSHTQVEWANPKEKNFGVNFQLAYDAISARKATLWNGRIPRMICAYFEDMRVVLRELRGRAKPRASAWIVVSTSAYGGVEIPVDLILADIAVNEGWLLREVTVVRHLRRVPVQQWEELSKRPAGHPYLRESVVILDAGKR